MLANMISSRLAIEPSLSALVLTFFAYSFCGYILECIVLSVEHRHLVVNRGFVKRLPFCIIYGFGGLIGYAMLSPLRNSWLTLFVVGAVAASVLEFIVAQLQLRLFGSFWWDYKNKPFNYKGILCLESTIGWGLAALFIIKVMHHLVVGAVGKTPNHLAAPIAVFLLLAYGIDFLCTARSARKSSEPNETQEPLRLDQYRVL